MAMKNCPSCNYSNPRSRTTCEICGLRTDRHHREGEITWPEDKPGVYTQHTTASGIRAKQSRGKQQPKRNPVYPMSYHEQHAVSKTKMAVFDIDDTLLDVSQRMQKAHREGYISTIKRDATRKYQKGRASFTRFVEKPKNLRLDEPIHGTVNFINGLASKGYTVAYLSGRTVAAHEITKEILEDAGFPVFRDDRGDLLFLKPTIKGSTPEHKDKTLAQLTARYDVHYFFDDVSSNLEVGKKHGIPGLYPSIDAYRQPGGEEVPEVHTNPEPHWSDDPNLSKVEREIEYFRAQIESKRNQQKMVEKSIRFVGEGTKAAEELDLKYWKLQREIGELQEELWKEGGLLSLLKEEQATSEPRKKTRSARKENPDMSMRMGHFCGNCGGLLSNCFHRPGPKPIDAPPTSRKTRESKCPDCGGDRSIPGCHHPSQPIPAIKPKPKPRATPVRWSANPVPEPDQTISYKGSILERRGIQWNITYGPDLYEAMLTKDLAIGEGPVESTTRRDVTGEQVASKGAGKKRIRELNELYRGWFGTTGPRLAALREQMAPIDSGGISEDEMEEVKKYLGLNGGRDNPPNAKKVKKAKKAFDDFHGGNKDVVVKKEIIDVGDVWYSLGECWQIGYLSPKETGDDQQKYVHQMNEESKDGDFPKLYATMPDDGEPMLIIKGGSLRIEKRDNGVTWLVD